MVSEWDSNVDPASSPPGSAPSEVRDPQPRYDDERLREHSSREAEGGGGNPVVPTADITIPWDKYTIQDDKMARLGIAAYTPLGILTCIKCKSVIDPCNIYTHIRGELPHADVDKDYCQSLRERFSLIEAHELKPPTTLRPAIPNLQLHHNYSYCSVCCHAYQREHSLMTKHHCPHFSVRSGCAQAYFPFYHHGGFFAVAKPLPPPTDQGVDFVEVLKSKYRDPVPADLPIDIPENPRDSNHFLSHRNWGGIVKGLCGRQLWDAVRTANQNLRGAIRHSVDWYVNDVNGKLKTEHPDVWGDAIGSYTMCVSCMPSVISVP